MASTSGAIPNGMRLDGNGIRVVQAMESAQVIGLWVETLTFGIFVMTYSKGTWFLLRGDQPSNLKRRNHYLLAANTVMLITSFVHLCLTVVVTLYVVVYNGGSYDQVLAAFGDSFARPVSAVQFILYATQTLIGDGFMLYRLWIIWDRRWMIVAPPAILFVVNGVCGYVTSGSLDRGAALIFYIVSFLTNTIATSLIMGRLLHTGADSSLVQAHWSWRRRVSFVFVRYRRVFEAIIESAAAYSLSSIALLVMFFVSPNVGYTICFYSFSPLMGIVFSMIVVQIAKNSAVKEPSALFSAAHATATLSSPPDYVEATTVVSSSSEEPKEEV